MKRHQVTRFSAVLAAFSALALTAPAIAQGKTPSDSIERTDRARSLFKQGLEALAAHKFEVARSHLLEAFKLSPSFDVAGALGQAELELRRYRDAAEHLDLSLRNFPPSESLELRKKVSDGLELAKKRVCALRLSVAPAGTEVRVDGALIGTAPVAPQVFVEPGARVLEARLASGETDSITIRAAAGSEQSLSLAPKRKEVAPPVAAPGASVATPHQHHAADREHLALLHGVAGGAGERHG